MFDTKEKREIVNKHQLHTTDTGSPEVQVALFTTRIQEIAKHLASNKNDKSALRGLQQLVAKRKKLLSYLQQNNPTKHSQLVKELGIRG